MPLSHPLWGVRVSRSSEERSWFRITAVLCSLPSFCTNPPKNKACFCSFLRSKEIYECGIRVVQQHMLCRVADVISHGIINICWWNRNLVMFCKKMITDSSKSCQFLCCHLSWNYCKTNMYFSSKGKNNTVLTAFIWKRSEWYVEKFIRLFSPEFDVQQSVSVYNLLLGTCVRSEKALPEWCVGGRRSSPSWKPVSGEEALWGSGPMATQPASPAEGNRLVTLSVCNGLVIGGFVFPYWSNPSSS